MVRQAWQQVEQQLTGESTQNHCKDAVGREQVSDAPPTDGTPFEQLKYRHNVNIIPEHLPTDE